MPTNRYVERMPGWVLPAWGLSLGVVLIVQTLIVTRFVPRTVNEQQCPNTDFVTIYSPQSWQPDAETREFQSLCGFSLDQTANPEANPTAPPLATP